MIAQISPKETVAETFQEFLAVIAASPETGRIAESPLTMHIFYAGAQAALGVILNTDTEDSKGKASHTAALLQNLGNVKHELSKFAMLALSEAFETMYERAAGR